MTARLNLAPASQIVRLIRNKSLSPVEVVQTHLDCIARLNPSINAICTVAADQAMAAARRAEDDVVAGRPLGPLHGLPIGIKDITPTAGIRTTYGSPLFADNVPVEDASVVTQLKRAGAIVIGKTNTPEFAAGANTVNDVFGATRNPWDTALSVSGSTGGGAAAVACGMIALAEGSDYAGSLRVPAAFCGVVGIRPTAGTVVRHPTPLPWDMGSVTGPIARTAEDVALMLDAMRGENRLSPISFHSPWTDGAQHVREARSLAGIKIAYSPDIAGIGVDPEIEALCRDATIRLRDHGALVEEGDFSLAEGRDAYLTFRGQTMVARFFDHLGALEKFGPNLRSNIEAGLRIQVTDIAAAERRRAELWQRCVALFTQYSLLLTPTAPVPPFPVEDNYPAAIGDRKLATYIDWVAPTFLVTLCGLPAASVPCGLTKNGLPVGLQIIGPRFSEPQILAACKFVQEANPIGPPPLVN